MNQTRVVELTPEQIDSVSGGDLGLDGGMLLIGGLTAIAGIVAAPAAVAFGAGVMMGIGGGMLYAHMTQME